MISNKVKMLFFLIVPMLFFGITYQAEASVPGLDLNGYCRAMGHSHATLEIFNAYGWKCVKYDGSHVGMNLNQACQMQHSDSPYARFWDFNNPYSWYCSNGRITYHGNGWCSATPADVANEGWRKYQAYYDAQTNLGNVTYYVYYQGNYVGPNVTQLEGHNSQRNQWQFGIDSTWAWQNSGWEQESRWRVDYQCN